MPLIYPVPRQTEQMWGDANSLVENLLSSVLDPNRNTQVPQAVSQMAAQQGIEQPQTLPQMLSGQIMPPNPKEAILNSIMSLGISPLEYILYHQTRPEFAEAIKKEGFKIMPLNPAGAVTHRAGDIGVGEGIFLKKERELVRPDMLGEHTLRVDVPDKLNILDIGHKYDQTGATNVYEYLSPKAKERYRELQDKLDDAFFDSKDPYGDRRIYEITTKTQKLVKSDLKRQGYDGMRFADPVPLQGMDTGQVINTTVIFDPEKAKVLGTLERKPVSESFVKELSDNEKYILAQMMQQTGKKGLGASMETLQYFKTADFKKAAQKSMKEIPLSEVAPNARETYQNLMTKLGIKRPITVDKSMTGFVESLDATQKSILEFALNHDLKEGLAATQENLSFFQPGKALKQLTKINQYLKPEFRDLNKEMVSALLKMVNREKSKVTMTESVAKLLRDKEFLKSKGLSEQEAEMISKKY